MANFDIKDFTLGTAKTIKSTTNAGVETPHHNVDTLTTITNVVHVDDNSSTLSVDDGGGSITVDGTVTANLAAGTNAIGKLAANSGVDIGDVDVTTLGGQSPAYGSGSAGATVLRTVLATDSPGVTALGQTTKAGSLPVTMASDQNPAHDAVDSVPPVKIGGYAKAAAPTDVSADADVVNAWFLRNGAQATVITAAGALVGGDATNGLDVDVTRMSALVAGTAVIGKVGIDQTTPGTTNAVQEIGTWVQADDAAFTPATSKIAMVGFEADETATDSVDEGDGGAARMTLDRKQIVTAQPHTAGGLSVNRNLDVDETEDDIKTSAGCLYKLRITNFSTSPRYVKLYNATAASTTVGSTTPLDTIPVPGAASASLPTVITENFGGLGLTFDTALCIAATTALADADTGAPGANDVVVSSYYK